ncbi:hypothetical protein BH11CYA1_BH11CYA1_32190 [soil metagenome]
MVAANSDRAHAASVRMFDEVSNYQVDGRATMKAGQAGQSSGTCHDHKPDSQPSKPWRPENGVCAPGSPIKINCFDEKDGKGDLEQKLQKLEK